MNRTAFSEKITEVGHALSLLTGEDWTLSIDPDTWSNRATLTALQGSLLIICGGAELHQAHATIYGQYPPGSGYHYDDHSQISLSLSKPAERVAKEITTRLLLGLGYRERYEQSLRQKARADQAKQDREEMVARLAAFVCVEPYTRIGYNEAPRLPAFPITDEVRGHLELESTGMWNVMLKGVSEHHVASIIEAVKAVVTEGGTPVKLSEKDSRLLSRVRDALFENMTCLGMECPLPNEDGICPECLDVQNEGEGQMLCEDCERFEAASQLYKDFGRLMR